MQHQWLGADAVGDWDLPNKPSPECFRLPSQTGKGKKPPKTRDMSNHKAGKDIRGYVVDCENTKAEAMVREVKRCARMKTTEREKQTSVLEILWRGMNGRVLQGR